MLDFKPGYYMQLHKLTYTSKVFVPVQVLEPTVISLISDVDIDVNTIAKNVGIKVTNLQNLVIGAQSIRLLGQLFNGIKYFKNQKEHFIKEKEGVRKIIPLKNKIPRIAKGQFVFYDHTLITQATKKLYELQTAKKSLEYLFKYINEFHKDLKTKHPSIKHEVMFILNPKDPSSLFHILKSLVIIQPNKLDKLYNGFDNYVLARVIDEKKSMTTPILMYDDKGRIRFLRGNTNYINTYFESNVEIKKNIVAPKETSATDKRQARIAGKNLDKILKNLQVTDRSTEENIKIALQKYKSTDSEDDVKLRVLKAVHHSIYGSDEVEDRFLNNPADLFSKLNDANIYRKEINIPNINKNRVVQPVDVIDFTEASALFRKEYEFKDTDKFKSNIHNNIADLFRTLSNKKDFPVDLLKIDHTYEDNNVDRTINYTATLQNRHPKPGPPYQVKLKVPALVNDKYFKLNGKTYIMANQLFLMPITKTTSDEVRLLTNYAPVTMAVVNLKYNVSEIADLLDFISIKYPTIIKEFKRDETDNIYRCEFVTGEIIDLKSVDERWISSTEAIVNTADSENWMYKDIESGVSINEYPLGIGENEFLYERVTDLVSKSFPLETFKSKPKAIPYIRVHIGGIKLPYILYLWQQIGLLHALVKVGADFTIGEFEDEDKKGDIVIKLQLNKNKNLFIYKTTERARLVSNGLLTLKKKAIDFDADTIDEPSVINIYLNQKYGSRTVGLLNRITENVIDTITHDLLEFGNMPTNLVDLSSSNMIHMLLNEKAANLADLRIHRSRQAEMIFNFVYKNLAQAHTEYENSARYGDENAKIFLVEDYKKTA